MVAPSTVTDVAAAAELNIQEGTATRGGPRKDTAANRIGDAAATDEYLNLAEHRRLRRDCYLATASGGSFNLASVFVETDPDITPLLTTLPSSAATATKVSIDQIAAQPEAVQRALLVRAGEFASPTIAATRMALSFHRAYA